MTDILMPALSPTMEEGTLAKWLVKEGDTISAGQVIAEIETDKATMEVEAVDEGEIAEILVAEGAQGVKVNTPIARLKNGDGSSASPAMSAMSWFTGTSAVPSGTTILARMPSSTASTSMVALSVSISAMMSPDLTVSPSFFSHLARLPFSIVGDRAGIRMLMGMAFWDPDLRKSN